MLIVTEKFKKFNNDSYITIKLIIAQIDLNFGSPWKQ